MKKKSDYFEKKVKRLLDEGKVRIESIGNKYIWAEADGKKDIYMLCYNRETYKWTCTCTHKTNFQIDENVYCTHMEAADIVRVTKGLR
jgi:hypothetical protein